MSEPTPERITGSGAPAEGYQALYRRFRPQRFSELRGQDHGSLALRNAVRSARVGHAYLFSGPRGTGKTSSARILAKALNCAEPIEGEPCGACGSCRAIAAGSSFDVHELDAASSNGVEAMRELVARASLATPGRWKVYIVDEVHMLSTAASNALLKTLEEPPAHVVFVLATTEPQKVLPTIRSRTQHFEFHLLDDDVLSSLLDDVAALAGLDLPAGTVKMATRRARGSARDALSALDQAAASGVLDDDQESLAAIVGGLARRETAAALTGLESAVRAGRDPEQVAVELVERVRTGFLAEVAPGVGGAAPAHSPEHAEVEELGLARAVRVMEVLGAALVAMRDAPDTRITLELALVRCSLPEADDSPAARAERIEQIERRLATGLPTAPETASPAPPPAAAPTAAPVVGPSPGGSRRALGAYRRPEGAQPTPAAAAAAPPAGGSPAVEPPGPPAAPAAPAPAGGPSRDDLVAAWGDHVLPGLALKLRAYYAAGRFVASEAGPAGEPVAVLAFPNAAHVEHAEPLRGDVERALGAHFGRPVRMHLVVDDERDDGARRRAPARTAAEAVPEPDDDELSALREPPEEDESTPQRVPAGGLAWAEGRLLEAFPGAEEV